MWNIGCFYHHYFIFPCPQIVFLFLVIFLYNSIFSISVYFLPGQNHVFFISPFQFLDPLPTSMIYSFTAPDIFLQEMNKYSILSTTQLNTAFDKPLINDYLKLGSNTYFVVYSFNVEWLVLNLLKLLYVYEDLIFLALIYLFV